MQATYRLHWAVTWPVPPRIAQTRCWLSWISGKLPAMAWIVGPGGEAKVFCFFSSEKKNLTLSRAFSYLSETEKAGRKTL
jgi:hypothetical protein